jgi:non-homologous end joining protein Ku
MALQIQLGLLKIPISAVNFANSRYSSTGLHQFSVCCKEAVGIKNYCKGCGKDVSKEEIVKGIDKDTLLSESQQEALKESLENGIMEVLGIKDITETTYYDFFPFVQKAQMILPSTHKGYKKTEIKTFYSFKSALKEVNKFCLVKLTQRATEHIGFLMLWKDDLIFAELPFKHYNNFEKANKLKEAIEDTIKKDKIAELDGFKEQAEQFITQYKSKAKDIDEIEETKKVLLKSFVESISKGEQISTIVIDRKDIDKNPFAL